MRLLHSRHNQRSLVRNCEHYLETMMSDETTTRPDVMAGYVITRPGLYQSRGGDIVQITGWEEGWWVSEWNGIRTEYGSDGRQRFPAEPDTDRWDLARWVAPLPASEQLAEIEGQPEPVQVREGRWRTRGEQEVQVTAAPTDHDDFSPAYPWWDGDVTTWANDGRFAVHENAMDLVAYLGPIEPEIGWQAEAIGRLQGEAHDLNMEIGGLQRQLAVVKEQLTTAAAVCQQLQIELDAAQQVPADSPELRQLQLRLADMTLDRDQCKDAYDRIFADLVTIRETTKAEAVEAIVEWLQPVRRVDSPSLANETMQHLPQIMRHLTGLAQD